MTAVTDIVKTTGVEYNKLRYITLTYHIKYKLSQVTMDINTYIDKTLDIDPYSKDIDGKKDPKEFFVYLLESSVKGSTYIGATVNLNRRLRQHNKEIKGGATYTGSKVSRGETWHRVCYVSGFPEWRTALQFEWRWKQISRKIDKQTFKKPIERRMEALKILLSLDKATAKSIPYNEWSTNPNVVYES